MLADVSARAQTPFVPIQTNNPIPNSETAEVPALVPLLPPGLRRIVNVTTPVEILYPPGATAPASGTFEPPTSRAVEPDIPLQTFRRFFPSPAKAGEPPHPRTTGPETPVGSNLPNPAQGYRIRLAVYLVGDEPIGVDEENPRGFEPSFMNFLRNRTFQLKPPPNRPLPRKANGRPDYTKYTIHELPYHLTLAHVYAGLRHGYVTLEEVREWYQANDPFRGE